jgi:hypothetical protein
MVEYSAFWAGAVPQDVRAWCLERGLEYRVGDGRPFVGMCSSVRLGPLDEAQVVAFRTLFKPDDDVVIDILEPD